MSRWWWVPFAAGTLGVLSHRDENLRFALLPLLATIKRRWRQEDLLANHSRGQLLGVIKALPGIHLKDLKVKVGINDGVATYHLYVLEREGLIRSEPNPLNRRQRCFYPTEVKLESAYYRLTQTQMEIVIHLAANPGATVSEMARALQQQDGTRYKRQTLDFNVKRLWHAGCLRRKPGDRHRWYPVPERLPELFGEDSA